MEQLGLYDIYSLQKKIKKKAKEISGVIYSNLYQLYVPEMEHIRCDYRITDSSLVFSYIDEKGICRVFFTAYDLEVLKKELTYFPVASILDYVCQGENLLDDVFEEGGFKKIASYTRKSTNLLQEGKEFKRSHSEILDFYYDETVGEYATEEDAEEIVKLLDKIFDKEIDHIPTVAEIRDFAKKNWILVYRISGEIRALYVYQIQGKKFYSNISYNSLPAIVLYCLEKRAHMEVIENYDVIMKYSWINTENEKSLKRNILGFDNVFTYIYKKE